MPNSKKITQVKLITDSLNVNKHFIILKYRGVTTKTLEQLRKKLKPINSSLTIIKNTLFEKTINILSVKNKFFKRIRERFFPLKEPSIIIYLGKDWHNALKTYYNFTQNLENFAFRFGILEDEIYDKAQLINISEIPPKDQLVAKLLNQFSDPGRRLVYSMKFNISKLVYILNQKSTEGR